MLLNFGQPVGGIVQMAYVVDDIQTEMARWIKDLAVGPWFLLDSFTGVDAVYRGAASTADVTLAMAFSGSMLIELIQRKDDHPSVYKELRGYGFHHFGVVTATLDDDVAGYMAQGYEVAFSARVPTGDRIVYLDTKGALPGFIELIEYSTGVETHFSGYYKAALGWDGTNPVRPFL